MVNLAVIGAGIGGCSAAYFAHKYLPYSKVTVYEMENRVGGRVYTFNGEEMKSEIGATFFNPINKIVCDLVKEMNLKVKKLEDSVDIAVWNGTEIIFKSGQPILEEILKKSPTLAALLIPGFRVKTPFDLRNVAEKTAYYGKTFPTYFKFISKEKKECPINCKCRVKFETDVCNDYFQREDMPGTFKLIHNYVETDFALNLWNGLATLTINLPKSAKIGDLLTYKSIVTDPTQLQPFESAFQLLVSEERKKSPSGTGERKKPPADTKGNSRMASSQLSLPQIIEVHQDRWSEFGFNEFSGIDIKDTGDEGYDFFINMDNIFLLSEIKVKDSLSTQLLQEQYKYAMVLIGLALLKEENHESREEDFDIFGYVSETTKKLAPIILPMISYLSDMEISD